jgi:geranylgeranyl reductase family protein
LLGSVRGIAGSKELTRTMYKVGIVGAGVGGSYLAYLLSKRGIDTVIFDCRVPHEKLCGGGVTHKVMADFPLLQELPCPRNKVRTIVVISPKGRTAAVKLDKPLTIFNRRDLDCMLLKTAQELGAYFRGERVRLFSREGRCWRIFTDQGEYRAEILVGADGAMSRTRRILGVAQGKPDYFLALECFLGLTGDSVTFKFFPDLKGYLWSFPRVDRTGVGIMCRHGTASGINDLKEMLRNYIEMHFPGQVGRVTFRGAYIPFFSAEQCRGQRICSENWALIGDAASFVDPINGEGIYYALYSADILASCITENTVPLYRRLCMERIGGTLLEASRRYHYLYRDEFIETMIALVHKSRTIRGIMSEMMAGDINYVSYTWRFARYLMGFLSMLGWHEKAW